MIKNTLAVLVIFSFLNLTVAPSYLGVTSVFAAENTEDDDKSSKALAGMFGLLIMFALFKYLGSSKDLTDSYSPEFQNNRFRVNLDLNNYSDQSNKYNSTIDLPSPTINMSYSW